MSCNDLSIGAGHVEVFPRAGIVAVGTARPAKLERCLRHSIAPRTVGHVHRVLHRALGEAKSDGYATENMGRPASGRPRCRKARWRYCRRRMRSVEHTSEL